MMATKALALVAAVAVSMAAPARADDGGDWPEMLPLTKLIQTPAGAKVRVPVASAGEVHKKNRALLAAFRKRKMCRYRDEAACVANSCHWCVGRCSKPTPTSNCLRETAEERAFTAQLAALFPEGADEAGAATEQRGAKPLFIEGPGGFPGVPPDLDLDDLLGSSLRLYLEVVEVKNGAAQSRELKFPLIVKGTLTVANLRAKVSTVEGIDIDQVTLAHDSMALADDEVLEDVLESNSRVTCNVAPPMPNASELPEVPAYKAKSCDWKCKVVKRGCGLFSNADTRAVCKVVAPYLTSIDGWKKLADAALAMWELFKRGNHPIAKVFTNTFKVLNALQLGIDKIGDLVDKLDEFADDVVAIAKSLAVVGVVYGFYEAMELAVSLGMFRMANPRLNNPQLCYACSAEFEIISELMGIDDPCVQAITSAMWLAINGAYVGLSRLYWVSSGPVMLDYSLCSTYNTFYCQRGVTCDQYSNTRGESGDSGYVDWFP